MSVTRNTQTKALKYVHFMYSYVAHFFGVQFSALT